MFDQNMNKANWLMKPLAVIVGITLFASLPSQASVLEEIVVTAQKREQKLQDVGIAVTAFSGDQLNQLGFTDSTDLVAQTPGLEVSGTSGGSNHTFSVRGVTQNDFSAAQEGPVAVYIDDAYLSHNFITGFSLYDIERVEVLKGPQGTLFGRNATGGLVHYVTVRPSQEAEGYVTVEMGEDGRRRIEGAIGGGLSDTVSYRLAANYNKGDGLIENDIGPDTMSADDRSVRAQLLFEPSDTFDALLKVQYYEEDSISGGYGFSIPGGDFECFGSYTVTDTDCFGYTDVDGDPYTASLDFDGFVTSEVLDTSLHLNWELGSFDVVSITNYQDIEHAYGEDSDVSPNSVYHYISANEAEQFSQELRISGETDSSRWIAGLYYLEIKGDYDTNQTGDVFFAAPYDIEFNQKTETMALFGQIEFDLSEQLTLIAGLRVNRDEKEFDISFDFGGFVFGERAQDFSDTDYSGKLQLDYRLSDDTLIYAGINRGIKSGGFNLPLDDTIATEDYQYGGEVLTTYEAGIKTQLTETVRLNVSAYYYDYKDQQVFSFDGFVPFLFNADEGENKGVEIELVASPIEGLDLLLGVAYQDPEIENDGLTATPVLAADWTVNGLARYEWPAFNGSLYVQTDFNWKDDHNFNLVVTPSVQEDAYALVNAKVGYTSDDDKWSVSVFARNLADTEYRRYAFDTLAYFGADENILGTPRWVGGNVTYNW